MEMNEVLKDFLLTACGGIFVKAWDFFFPSKREKVDTGKISTETILLTKEEQRVEAKFCQEQLTVLEGKFIAQTTELEKMRAKVKEITTMYEELDRKHNETLNDFTFIKIKLAAYEL